MNRPGHGCWITLLAACAATACADLPAVGGEIRIWPSAVVSGDSIKLADLADLRGFDAASCERLGQIVVQAAPAPGGEMLVKPSDVRGALAEANADLGSIQILGSSRCKVSKPRPPPEPKPVAQERSSARATLKQQPPPQSPQRERAAKEPPPVLEREAPVQPDTLESSLRQYIASRVPGHGAKIEIRFSPANREDLRLREPEYRFDIRPKDDRPVGLLSFEVDLVREGQVERTAPIVAEVWLIKDVVVARQAINRGAVIEGRNLKLEERRFSDVQSIGVTELAAAVGQQSQQFIKPGEMLVSDWLRAKAMIGRGDHVTIWSRQGGLVIKTTGTAQQAGALGEVIEVRRDGTKRKEDMIDAEITGPGTVTLTNQRQVAQR
jgi:flagella basal body P-ring formation protein FlgA